jgi:hypothetical protein
MKRVTLEKEPKCFKKNSYKQKIIKKSFEKEKEKKQDKNLKLYMSVRLTHMKV